MLKSAILLIPIKDQKNVRKYLVSLSVGDNGQSDVLVAFYRRIAFVFHVALIMFLVLLAY